MDGTILNFFAGGNTAHGFSNLYESSLQGLTRLFVLKGGPGTRKLESFEKSEIFWLNKVMRSG